MALTLASMPGMDGPLGFLHRLSRKRERHLAGFCPPLARCGTLEARLAVTNKDVRRAQKLRYRAFFEEGGAIPDPTARITRRDICPFDGVSDHLIVVDTSVRHRDGSPPLVGVYRLLRQDVAERNFGFYSALEFDVDSLIARRPTTRFLEVGRACIAPTYRGRRVLELLWRGLWAYARLHNIDAMIGCASLPGADPVPHEGAIRALAAGGGDPSWRVAPRRPCSIGGCAPPLDPRALIRVLPALVKGYWRLGAIFSPFAAVDLAFNTTDVFVAMPLSDIKPRYLQYFGVEHTPATLAA